MYIKVSLDSVKYFVAGPFPNGLKDVGQKEVSLSKQGEKLQKACNDTFLSLRTPFTAVDERCDTLHAPSLRERLIWYYVPLFTTKEYVVIPYFFLFHLMKDITNYWYIPFHHNLVYNLRQFMFQILHCWHSKSLNCLMEKFVSQQPRILNSHLSLIPFDDKRYIAM